MGWTGSTRLMVETGTRGRSVLLNLHTSRLASVFFAFKCTALTKIQCKISNPLKIQCPPFKKRIPNGLLVERGTRDRRFRVRIPAGAAGEFSSRINFLCWQLFGVRSTPVLPQWHAKRPQSFWQKCRWQVTPTHAMMTKESVKSVVCRHEGTASQNNFISFISCQPNKHASHFMLFSVTSYRQNKRECRQNKE